MDQTTLRFGAHSDVGRVRKINEDAFTVNDLDTGRTLESGRGAGELRVGGRGVLLAISDGMGGHEAGEVASAMVLESLCASLAASDAADPVEETVAAAVGRANADVIRASKTRGKHGMGATLTAVLFRPAEAYIAEVGDSRAYALRLGRLHQITRDQSLVQLLVDEGALSVEQARKSSNKNVLLQAVGHADEVQVAIGRLKLRRGDRFLLCCDGLSNALRDDELQDLLSEADPEIACHRMVDLANERGGSDNLTALVAHVGGELPQPSSSETVGKSLETLHSFRNPK